MTEAEPWSPLARDEAAEKTQARDENSGEASGDRPGAASSATLPTAFALAAPRPNPAAAATTLGFDVPETAHVRLAVYDLLGREVAVLVDGAVEAGRHTAVLDARGLSGGVYLARLTTAAGFAETRQLTLLR